MLVPFELGPAAPGPGARQGWPVVVVDVVEDCAVGAVDGELPVVRCEGDGAGDRFLDGIADRLAGVGIDESGGDVGGSPR